MSPTVQRPAAWAYSDEAFLGQVVAFTIGDVDITLDDLRSRMSYAGLRAEVIKRRIRGIDAFKRATAEIATKFTRYSDHQHALLVRQVGQDRQESHRLVVLERTTFRKNQHRRVDTVTLWRLMYDRTENLVSAEQQVVDGLKLADEERAWIDSVIGADGDQLRRRFELHSEHLDAHGVRSAVRDYLSLLNAVAMKGSSSGGLYFVPQCHVAELASLARVVRSVGSTTMQLIPLVNLPDVRDMLAESVVADLQDEARIYASEIAKINASPLRKVQQATFEAYDAKADALLRKLTDYEIILGTVLPSEELTIFKGSVQTLGHRVQRPRIMRRDGNESDHV